MSIVIRLTCLLFLMGLHFSVEAKVVNLKCTVLERHIEKNVSAASLQPPWLIAIDYDNKTADVINSQSRGED